MTLPLSTALLRGSGMLDIFTAALLGSVAGAKVPILNANVQSMSHSQRCKYILHAMHHAWSHIGQSVRAWPRFAEELERDRLIPRQPAGHVSLWKVLSDLHAAGESYQSIADRLRRHGL